MVERIVLSAIEVISVAKSKWSVVKGPGQAFVASAFRLRWQADSITVVVDDRGRELDSFATRRT